MLVKDVMTKNIVSVSPEDAISSALAKMKNNKIHQLPVIENKKICGMLSLKNIVTRGADLSTKAKTLMAKTPVIDASESAERAACFLLRTGAKAVPVMEKGRVVGVVSETDMIKAIKLNKKAGDIAVDALAISPEDNIGTIKSLMLDKNISRLPVVDDGKIVGVVGDTELIKVLEADKKYSGRESDKGGHSVVEKMRAEQTSARVIMRQPVVVGPDAPLSDVIKFLQNNEDVVIQNGGIRIITPRDIMECIAAAPEEGVYVQIANIKDEDEAYVEKMHKTAESFLHRTKMVDPEFLIVHLDRHNRGGKTQYDIRTRFSTHLGLFVSKAEDWGLETTFQESLNRLETEVKKKYGKLTGRFKKKHVGRKPR